MSASGPTGPGAVEPSRAVEPSGRLAAVDAAIARRLPPTAARFAGLAGALLAILGCNLPWSGYAAFPPDLTVAFYPAGAQIYALVLALAGGLVFLAAGLSGPLWRFVHGGAARAGGTVAAGGVLAVTGYTVAAIAQQGGGLINVAVGGWVTLVGGLVMLVAARAVPDPGRLVRRRRPAVPVQILLVAVALAGVLVAIVVGLAIEDAEVFVAYLLFLLFLVLVLQRLGLMAWLNGMARRNRRVTLIAAFVAAVAFPFTQGSSNEFLSIAATVGLFAATAMGLNIVVGLAGLLDLGYIAFFGVGSYVGALVSGSAFSTIGVELPWYVAIVLGAAVAGVFGVLIGAPTLRLRGDYLAIVTLGFGEIFRITMNNLDGDAGPDLTNGPNGIPAIPPLNIFGWDFGEDLDIFGFTLGNFANYYFLELILIAVVVLVFARTNASRIGRAWVAIREDEIAAAAMGINTTRLKLLAFALGATLAGAAGVVNAHLSASVTPDSFQFLQSVFLLAAIVLGGMGTVSGALLGSTLLIVLPEKLRFFSDYRLLIFGIALVLLMRFRPEGLIADPRRAREFHEADEEADALSAPPGSPVAQATDVSRL